MGRSRSRTVREGAGAGVEGEKTLHYKVVNFIRKHYPGDSIIIIVGLGELQNTSGRKLDAWHKGYSKGQPDLLLLVPHRTYSGFCIELKSPKGNGKLSKDQSELLEKFRGFGYLTLVSSDYDETTNSIVRFMKDSLLI
jgi:hypothetical protein